MTVYVCLGIDSENEVKECVVVTDSEVADSLYRRFQRIYGATGAYLGSRVVDEVPDYDSRNPPKPKPYVGPALHLPLGWPSSGRHG